LRRPYGYSAKIHTPLSGDNCLCHARFEQLGEILGRNRPAEIVSLGLVTLVSLKKCQLYFRFHSLSNHPKLKASPHTNHCGHNDRLVGNSGDLPDERLINLEGIDGKLSEILKLE